MIKKILTFTLPLFFLFGLFVPSDAFAHENYQFKIGDEAYEITIGSLNEPIVVDDKTGVDFRIERQGISPEPVEGLEDDLQVELLAGDQSKVLNLEASYGSPGAYEATFYPTVATQLEYRIFGEINGVDFDYTFECNPQHPDKEDSNEEVEVSEDVSLVHRSGSYSCPQPKADLGFPEPSSSINDLADKSSLENLEGSANTAKTVGWIALFLGLISLAIAIKK